MLGPLVDARMVRPTFIASNFNDGLILRRICNRFFFRTYLMTNHYLWLLYKNVRYGIKSFDKLFNLYGTEQNFKLNERLFI